MARRGRDNDGKYLRLTGLWPSKKNDRLWTGKIRNQDLGVLLDKVEEADKANADVVVFLWENTEKKGKQDPEFTVQISVSEEQEGRSRSSSRRSSRDNDRDQDNQNEQEEEVANEEPEEEEKPRSRHSKSSSKEESKSRSKSRSTGSSKRDKNDW